MDIVFRALAAYIFILFLMRVVGRRELSSMEPSDVILLVVIGDLVQNGVTQNDYSVTGVVLAAGTVDKHALKRDAEKVASLATEGELLANDMSKGASTKYFARVHAKELSRAASNLADALAERPTSPGIEPDVRKLSRLAAKLSRQLEQLHLHPTSRAVAKSLEQPLSDSA